MSRLPSLRRRLDALRADHSSAGSGAGPLAVAVAIVALLAVVVIVMVIVAGEEGDGDAPDDAVIADASEGEAPESRDYLEVGDEIDLTELGTVLSLGESASVAWQASQETVAVVELSPEAIRSASPDAFDGWLVGGAGLEATPYFITLTVSNLGEADLGGRSLPLYLEREDGRLVPPSRFGAEFPACASTALPSPFATGESTTTCQVYLSEPGQEVTALVFLPFDGAETVRWDIAGGDIRPAGTEEPPTQPPTGDPTDDPTDDPVGETTD